MREGIEVRWSGEIESGLRRSQNLKMSIQHDLAAVVSINGEITVDARLIAPHLGLSRDAASCTKWLRKGPQQTRAVFA